MDEPILKAMGAPQAGQEASTLIGRSPRAQQEMLKASIRVTADRLFLLSRERRFAPLLALRPASLSRLLPNRNAGAAGNNTD
jgi:hypothetical protein